MNSKVENNPYLPQLVRGDKFAHSRVFVHETDNMESVERNYRMFLTHKDGDFLVYLPDLPNRREGIFIDMIIIFYISSL